MEAKTTSRKDYFKKLQAEKEEANQKGEGFEFENPEFVDLKEDVYRIVRLLGSDYQAKERQPTDPKLFKTLWLKGDDGKKIKVIFNNDPNWPFTKMVKQITKGKWIDGTDGKKKKIYDYEGKETLKIVNSNYNDDGEFKQSWEQPTKYIGINVIDRMDKWCVENKHTKVLVHSANEKDGKHFPEIGIRQQAYDIIWTGLCTKYETHFNDFDIAIRRVPTALAKKNGNNYYDILRAERAEADLIEAGEKAGLDYASAVVTGAPTDEEEAFERYDFDNMPCFMPTATKRIFNHIKNFVKKVDAEFNSNYVEEFNEYIKSEEETRKKFWADYKAKKASEKGTDVKAESKPDSTETEKPAVRRAVKEIAKEVKASTFTMFDFSTQDMTPYEGFENLTYAEKSLIIGIDETSGELLFKPECETAECPIESCSFKSPTSGKGHDEEGNVVDVAYTRCPYCNSEFA